MADGTRLKNCRQRARIIGCSLWSCNEPPTTPHNIASNETNDETSRNDPTQGLDNDSTIKEQTRHRAKSNEVTIIGQRALTQH